MYKVVLSEQACRKATFFELSISPHRLWYSSVTDSICKVSKLEMYKVSIVKSANYYITLYVKLSNSFNCKKFSISHWGALDDSFCIT